MRNPGLYEVAVGTDLGRLLALTGGAAYDVREDRERQRAEVRLYRPQEGVVLSSTTADIAANPSAFPPLREGDSIIVDVIRKRQFGWQDAATIAGGLSGVALLISVLAGR